MNARLMSNSNGIFGIVKDGNGRGLWVSPQGLNTVTGAVAYETKTNADGNYTIESVVNGDKMLFSLATYSDHDQVLAELLLGIDIKSTLLFLECWILAISNVLT